MKKNSRMLKRLLSGALVLAFVGVPLLSTGAVAEEAFDWESYLDWTDDEIPTEFVSGFIPMDPDVIEAHRGSIFEEMGISPLARTTFPTSVDLSTSIYFPPIRTQGIVSSCAAFATVYYQYTYAVNALNNTSAQIVSNQYSPSWPYYAMTPNNLNSGSMPSDIYAFLKDHGALKWTEDEYFETFQPSMPWPTNTDYMREALNTRLYQWNTIEISSEGTVITSNNDTDLDEIKAALNYGKPLVVGTWWANDRDSSGNPANYYYNKTRDPDADKTIYYRCGEKYTKNGETLDAAKHAITIVGYDDNLTYDINNNGTIEAGERGALKIANSHGDVFGDQGFFWLMYDALNEVSSVSGNWDIQSTRISAFADYNPSKPDEPETLSNNVFTYIYVEEKEPLFLAEINLKAHDLSMITLSLVNRKQSSTQINRYGSLYGAKPYIVSSRTLIFDYEELINTFDYNRQSMYWGVELSDWPNSYSGSIVSSIKLTDNIGTTMKNMTLEEDNIHIFSCNANFEYGDVNYDGTLTSADVSSIMNYVTGSVTYSNVQIKLADYNGDGKVNLTDATALNAAIS